MPVYVFQAPDGKKYRVEAASPEEAQQGFSHMVEQSPEMFAKPGVSRALKDISELSKNRSAFDRLTQRLSDSATLGLSTQFNAGLGAAGTGLRNLIPGLKADYSAKDFYDAWRLYEAADRAKGAARNPVLSTATDVLGSLAMPGGEAVGKFVVGKTAPALAATGKKVPLAVRAGQTARASGVGALQAGAQGAALARPGEEAQDAQSGAVTGAVLAPVMGGGMELAARAAPVLKRTGQRLLGPMVAKAPKGEAILGDAARAALQPPTADATAADKLAKSLRREGLTPDVVEQVMTEWNAAGGVTPTLLDIVREAGASPGVFKLLGKSSSTSATRRMADQYARETVEGVQKKALGEVENLQTGEPRTPSQIKADLETQRGEIGAREAAGRQEPPPGAPRETGAAALADDLNGRYDASRKVYEDAYKEAEAAKAESAIVPDSERAPVITRIFTEMGDPNPYDPASVNLRKLVERLREGELPKPTAEELAAGVQESPTGTRPLTIKDLQNMRRALVSRAGETKSPDVQRQALSARDAIDKEMIRLAEEGKIEGDDPEVVDKWKTAILGFAKHKSEFGQGLAAKLTERVPGKPDERVVKGGQAADVIFGDKAKGVRSLNDIHAELEPVLPLVQPRTVETLQAELYGRIPPEDLAGIAERYPTSAPALLPKPLVEQSLAAQKATAEAQAAAEAERTALEGGEARALDVGQAALSTPSEAYAPAVESIDNVHMPVVASGAKQSIADYLENPDPAATARIRRLMGEQASKNLGATLGEDQVGTLQARLRNIQSQGRGAQELSQAVGSESMFDSPLLENIGVGEIAYPKRGGAMIGLEVLRKLGRLSPDEQIAAIRQLTSSDTASVEEVSKRLLKKYPAAKRAASAPVAKALSGRRGEDDELERLRLEYGLDY